MKEATLNFAMEFHDSILIDLQQQGGGKGFALFHAYVYRSEGIPFKDAQESGWQKVRFLFEGMRIDGEIIAFDEYASDGELWVNEVNERGCTTLPATHSGLICMELRLSPNFDIVKIYCSQISSSFEGEFELETQWSVGDNGELIH